MLSDKIRIEQFIETELLKKLSKLDNSRKSGLFSSWIIFAIIPVFLFALYFIGFKFRNSTNYISIVFTFFGFMCLVSFSMVLLNRKNKSIPFEVSFKEEIIKPFIQFINPDFIYKRLGYVNRTEFLNMGFFTDENYKVNGNDQVIGKYKDVLFQFCDLTVTKSPVLKSKNQQDDLVFCGNYFMAKFNKPFIAETYIMPKYSVKENILGSDFDTSNYIDSWELGENVKLEDPEFSSMYKVLSHDQIEARYILTPTFMEKIKSIQRKTKGKLLISFRNDIMYIGNNNGFDYFEPDFYKTLKNKDVLMDYYQEIIDLLTIIDDLNLNIKIWKKN